MDIRRHLTSVRAKHGMVSGRAADAEGAGEVSQDPLAQVEFFLFSQQLVFLCPCTKDQPKLLVYYLVDSG